ncbi:MAG: hypothetical protein EPO51_09920 [Phenylobacterium sp.]|uniref:hypothetical protein n=1 Tax=Phenylobacterium sp. TaxID=1871053 RepID=UPI00120B429F|nr:hypothetical protein [Phenylobacterium sp.]TAJ72410.1 MAG: hypothetical protein EPO51_09920 [Phenylobacterium sp.]
MPSETPTPSFAADIAPLFRPEDIACMDPMGVRLGDPAWMTDPAGDLRRPDHANARRVFQQLRAGRMPPGNPWSDAQLATYEAWMAGGFAP